MDMDVVGNKERLLKGILDGDTTTDIEPASREERLLKAILENGGGGGGSGSGELPTANCVVDSMGHDCIEFSEGIDYIGDEEHRTAFRVDTTSSKGKKTNLICFPILKQYGQQIQAVKLLIFNQYGCFRCFPEKTSDSPPSYVLRESFNGIYSGYVQPTTAHMESDAWHTTGTYVSGGYSVLVAFDKSSAEPMHSDEWWRLAGIKTINIADLSSMASSFSQVITMMKQLADASPGTMITKYMELSGQTSTMVSMLVSEMVNSINQKGTAVFAGLNSGTFAITDVSDTGLANRIATMVYKEIDFTNNKIYDMKFTFNMQKLFFQCTCHEATSLM